MIKNVPNGLEYVNSEDTTVIFYKNESLIVLSIKNI
jgi:hypothetical protein